MNFEMGILYVINFLYIGFTNVACGKSSLKECDLLNLLPDEWDWRSKGAVFPVSDQGPMGNVFAMVVSEAVSAYAFLKTRKLIKASAQELTDCCLNNTQSMLDPDDNDVYTCILGLRGLCLEADYPPAAESCSATKCVPKIKLGNQEFFEIIVDVVAVEQNPLRNIYNFDQTNVRLVDPQRKTISLIGAKQIDGGYQIVPLNETDMRLSVYRNPAVALVNAAAASFQEYISGVYDDTNCPTIVDHALLIVGYGEMDGKDVWYCKNSWGVNWGDRGYIYIARGKNVCGIESLVRHKKMGAAMCVAGISGLDGPGALVMRTMGLGVFRC